MYLADYDSLYKELVWPETSPASREDLLRFIERNLTALKQLWIAKTALRIAEVEFEDIEERFYKGAKNYAPWTLYGTDAKAEAEEENIDSLVYFGWELLQGHFSSVDA